MTASGSIPARHPSLGPALENPGADFFQCIRRRLLAQQQACQRVTKDEYCITTVNCTEKMRIKKKSAGKGTKIWKIPLFLNRKHLEFKFSSFFLFWWANITLPGSEFADPVESGSGLYLQQW
jgi:hypothetical protein